MNQTAQIQRSFSAIMDDLDFHQTIISRSRGRFKKYPLRTARYILVNRFLALRAAITRNPLLRVRTFWGDTMQVVFPTYRSIYHFGMLDSWELVVEKALVENLKEGDAFIDVGANVGFYTLLASALVGATGSVHAFEPTPSTFALLKQNAGEKKQIHLNQVALGAQKGVATLADFGMLQSGLNSLRTLEHAGLASKKIEVAVIRLDDYCQQHALKPKMIKMDAEGMELEVLKGAERILTAAKPLLVLEVGSPEESQELFAFLAEKGYQGFYSDEALSLKAYTAHAHGRMNMLFIPR